MKLEEMFEFETLRGSNNTKPISRIFTQVVGVKELIDMAFQTASNEGRVINASKHGWKKENLQSKKFTLVRAQVNKIADPQRPVEPNVVNTIVASLNNGYSPIIVDGNKHGRGTLAHLSFTPKAIVVDGREKFAAVRQRGESSVLAWVGDDILDYVQANGFVKPQELQTKIHDELAERFPKDRSSVFASGASVETVAPFENFFTYRFGGRMYKQQFIVTRSSDVLFVGNPKEGDQSIEASVGYSLEGPLAQTIQGCGCDAVKASEKKKGKKVCTNKNCMSFASGKKMIGLQAAVSMHKQAGSPKAKIFAVSAPGFEKTVEHLKEHPEVTNPHALSWYLYEQGASQHRGRKPA